MSHRQRDTCQLWSNTGTFSGCFQNPQVLLTPQLKTKQQLGKQQQQQTNKNKHEKNEKLPGSFGMLTLQKAKEAVRFNDKQPRDTRPRAAEAWEEISFFDLLFFNKSKQGL